jgi:hypothetical protein
MIEPRPKVRLVDVIPCRIIVRYPLPQRAFQHLVAILRDSDDVVAMVKNTCCCQSPSSSERGRAHRRQDRRVAAECIGVIGGVRMKLHVFCLPQSDACFIKAYPAETTEAFLDGRVSAFAFFGACLSRFCATI